MDMAEALIEYMQSVARVAELGNQVELVDADDPNLEAVVLASQMAFKTGQVTAETLIWVVGASYVAGRLRGRQEWTMKVGKDDNATD
jgi:hypothetical protein